MALRDSWRVEEVGLRRVAGRRGCQGKDFLGALGGSGSGEGRAGAGKPRRGVRQGSLRLGRRRVWFGRGNEETRDADIDGDGHAGAAWGFGQRKEHSALRPCFHNNANLTPASPRRPPLSNGAKEVGYREVLKSAVVWVASSKGALLLMLAGV